MGTLDSAKNLFWSDADNDGINDNYDWGPWMSEYGQNSVNGTTDTDNNGKYDIDCSHLVNSALNNAGYNIPYMRVSDLLGAKGKKYFEAPTDIMPGDLVVYKGHIGIVELYDPVTKSGTFFGSQTSTGPASVEFGPNAPYWKTPLKFLRPIEDLPCPGNSDNVLDSCRDLFTTAETTASPVILDLDGDGVETTGIAAGAYFDHDGNGFAQQTGWAGADDGMLVMDKNANGTIDNGNELFGNNTLLNNGSNAANGFQALSELDTNIDGKVDANDSAFSSLKIWQDTDGDGYSTASELHTLDELGIQSINTGYTDSTTVDANGNEHKQVGSFTKTDGSTGTATDVWFKDDRMYTIADEWLDVPADIAALPDLQGYGNVYDLQQAMTRDRLAANGEGLKGLVEQFAAASDVNTRNSLMEQILFKWTGSDGIDPDSRGSNIDARRLAVLEDLFGEAFIQINTPNPGPAPATLLEQSYKGIFEMYYAQMMSQTHLQDLYGMITYTWDETAQNVKGDLNAAATELQNRLTLNYESGKTDLGEFVRTLRGVQAEDMMNFETLRHCDKIIYTI